MKQSDDDGNDAAASVFAVWVVRPFDLHPYLFPNLQERLLLLSGRNSDQLTALAGWAPGGQSRESFVTNDRLRTFELGASSDTTTHGSLARSREHLSCDYLNDRCLLFSVITELRARRSPPVIRHQPDSGAQSVRPLRPDSCSYKL